MDKEKLIQIYEFVADITLAHLNQIKKADTTLDDSDISMISATLQPYNATADNHQPELFPWQHAFLCTLYTVFGQAH